MYDRGYYIDDLTGVLNRRYLHLIIDREISRSKRYNSSFSIILADLDNFKIINDTLGHIKGDQALAVFASVIKKALRDSDTIIRYGGDEFIIVLPETTLNEAKVAACRIIEHLKNIDFSGITLSASMGIAAYPEHGNTWSELFSTADRALFTAKRLGKGRVALPGEGEGDFIIPAKELIGRREEVTHLVDMLNIQGKLHVIVGEVGVGKTRLVKETIGTLHKPFLYTQSLGVLGKMPYFVLINLLKNLMKSKRADFFISFERIPTPLKSEIIKLLPDLFSRPVEHKEQGGDKYRLFEATLALLMDMFKGNKLILVFDDAQWIDRESAEFISYVVHMAGEKFVPLVIVRSEEIEKSQINEMLEILGRMRMYDVLEIKPLGIQATRKMLSSIMGGEVDGRLLDMVFGETGGNPFFIEEVIRNLGNGGCVYNKEGVWYLKDNCKIEPSRNVEEVVRRKIRTLSEEEREILVFSAVYGRKVDPYVLSRAGDMSEWNVYDAMDRFVKIGLMQEKGVDEYIFSEGIVRDTVLKNVSKSKLKLYHRKIADTLKEIYKNNLYEVIDELVYHYDMAGMYNEATKYCKAAGDRAFSIYAYEKAMEYYLRIIDTIKNDEEAKNLAYNIYYIFRNIGNIEVFEKALTSLYKRFPSIIGVVTEALGDAYFQRGMFKRAEKILREGLNATECKVTKTKLRVRLAWAIMYQGKIKEARDIVMKALTFYNEKLKNEKENSDTKNAILRAMPGAYNTLASSYLIEGNAHKAIEHYKKYLEFLKREDPDNEYNYAVGLVNIAIASVSVNNYEEALKYLEEAKYLSKKLHSIYLDSMVDIVLGELYVMMGDLERAGEYLEGAHRKYTAMNNEMRIIENNLSRYRYYLFRKNIDGAMKILEESLELAKLLSNEEYIVSILKGKVEVLIEKGNLVDAMKILESIHSDYSEMASKIESTLYLLKARIYVLQKSYEQAIKSYRKALEKDPENPGVLLGIAEAMVRRGNIKEGIEQAQKYEKLVYEKDTLDNFILRYKLGETYIIGGMKSKGLKIMKELYPILEKRGILLYIGKVAEYIFD